MFGSSSEKTEESAQLSIFNEAEEIADIRKPEPELEEVKSHYRKKRTKKDSFPEYLPVEDIEYRLNEDEQDCPNCGEKSHEMGKEMVREELKIIPAQAVIVRHVRYTYSCRNCEKTGTEVPVIKAPVKNAVIKGGFTSPEAVAYIRKMCKEDEIFTNMINYYLFEKAFDIHKNDPEEKLRKVMKKAFEELYSPDLI
jgi:hypothetical protein